MQFKEKTIIVLIFKIIKMINGFFIVYIQDDDKYFHGKVSNRPLKSTIIPSIVENVEIPENVNEIEIVNIKNVIKVNRKDLWSLNKGFAIESGGEFTWVIPKLLNKLLKTKKKYLKLVNYKLNSNIYTFDIESIVIDKSKLKFMTNISSLNVGMKKRKKKKVIIKPYKTLPFRVVIYEILIYLKIIIPNKIIKGTNDIDKYTMEIFGYFKMDGLRKIFQIFMSIDITLDMLTIFWFKQTHFLFLRKTAVYKYKYKCAIEAIKYKTGLYDFFKGYKNLEGLNLTNCKIYDNIFKCNGISKRLKYLEIYDTVILPNMSFENLVNLENLALWNVSIDNNVLKKMKSLKYIKLNTCMGITDEGLLPLINLIEIDIYFNLIIKGTFLINKKNVKKLNLAVITIEDKYLRNLSSLQKLKLLCVKKIRGTIFQYLKQLKNLEIIQCRSIENASLYDLNRLEILHLESIHIKGNYIKNIKNLKKLVVKYNDLIGNEEIINLINLQNLTLVKCVNVSDKAFNTLINLQKLTLVKCVNISDKAFNTLINLQKLTIKGCELIKGDRFSNLINLTHLILKYCYSFRIQNLNLLNKIEQLRIVDSPRIHSFNFSKLKLLKVLLFWGKETNSTINNSIGNLSNLEMIGGYGINLNMKILLKLKKLKNLKLDSLRYKYLYKDPTFESFTKKLDIFYMKPNPNAQIQPIVIDYDYDDDDDDIYYM